jgi:recombination protein RecT
MSTTTAIQPAQTQALDPQKKKIATFRQLLDASKEQIMQALPRHVDAGKMIRVVMTSIQKNPSLMDCDQRSVIGSVIEASQLGLMPDGILGEGYLVPYKGKCQFQPGYRGLVSLARRSGEVSDIYSELVFTCDKFHVTYGLTKTLEHEPNLEHDDYWKVDDKGNMPSLRGAYAVVVFKDGTRNFVYMPRKRLDQIRATSKSLNSNFSPWNTAVGAPEMFKKCPIRQLAKMLPLSPEFQKAAMLDEYADAGVLQGGEFNIDPASEAARLATEEKTRTLVEKYNPAAESQETGHDPAEESQEQEIITGQSVMADLESLKAKAQAEANANGEPVTFPFLGMTVIIGPDPSANPQQTSAEQTNAQPQASSTEHGESQPLPKSGNSRRGSKPEVQGVPLDFNKP